MQSASNGFNTENLTFDHSTNCAASMPAVRAQINPGTGYIENIQSLREIEYPLLRDTTYLDHAGTTLYPKSLIEEYSKDLTQNLFGNPHSASASSQLSSQRIDDVRLQVLRFFNAEPDHFDVVFTANATAAIKLVGEAFRDGPQGFDYAYHVDSHTSIVGVRELAHISHCLSDDAGVNGWLNDCQAVGGGRPRLFAYPGQSNMTGRRHSLKWAERVNDLCSNNTAQTYTLFDAAALASTAPLDLSDIATAPSFTAVSFYKIFGFPDLGALLVRKDAAEPLCRRKYFGGGTVEGVAVTGGPWHASKRRSTHDRLEDGTLPFHNIVALGHALRQHVGIYGSMDGVSRHCAYLTNALRTRMLSLRHGNGSAVCRIYGASSLGDTLPNGPVLAFNLLDNAGNYVSNAEVDKLAIVRRIHLRTGGLCNPGGTASYLHLTADDLRGNHATGYRCGDDNDIINGKPVGTIRVSLGAPSSLEDVDSFMDFLQDFYVNPTTEDRKTTANKVRGHGNSFTVEALTVFPIKSCAAFNVPSGSLWEVGARGLAWDREWCLVHEGTHQALSQKKYPRMALLRPTIDTQERVLRVTHNIHGSGWQQLEVNLDEALVVGRTSLVCDAAKTRRTSSVCGESVDIEHYTSPKVSHFFTEALGVPCTLARSPQLGSVRRPQIRSHTGFTPDQSALKAYSVGLANESPILLISRSSVNRLNEQIKARGGGGRAVPAESFRGNIIVSETLERGQSETPYAEDDWREVSIGSDSAGGIFEIIGPCQRCQMVCIDQGDGSRRQEPFSTLAKTRKKEGKVWFGMHMSLRQSENRFIKVGDYLQATSRSGAT